MQSKIITLHTNCLKFEILNKLRPDWSQWRFCIREATPKHRSEIQVHHSPVCVLHVVSTAGPFPLGLQRIRSFGPRTAAVRQCAVTTSSRQAVHDRSRRNRGGERLLLRSFGNRIRAFLVICFLILVQLLCCITVCSTHTVLYQLVTASRFFELRFRWFCRRHSYDSQWKQLGLMLVATISGEP